MLELCDRRYCSRVIKEGDYGVKMNFFVRDGLSAHSLENMWKLTLLNSQLAEAVGQGFQIYLAEGINKAIKIGQFEGTVPFEDVFNENLDIPDSMVDAAVAIAKSAVADTSSGISIEAAQAQTIVELGGAWSPTVGASSDLLSRAL